MPEFITAYHEAGHCIMAKLLGGVVEIATILPDYDDGPERFGDVRIRWSMVPDWKDQALVALAGPAAEMVYRQEPFHPAFLAECSQDWRFAWNSTRLAFPDDLKRLRLLEKLSGELYQIFSRDEIWNAVAALADELIAHETIYECDIEETLRIWLGWLKN